MSVLVIWFLIYIAIGLILMDPITDHPFWSVLFWIVPIVLWGTLIIIMLLATSLMHLALKIKPKKEVKKE